MRHTLLLRECWQKPWPLRYLDLSVFAVCSAGNRPAGDPHDRDEPQGFAGRRGWHDAAAGVVPGGDMARCSMPVLDRSAGKRKRPHRRPDPDRSSDETRLTERPCLSQGRTRQQAPLMAGYALGEVSIKLAPVSSPKRSLRLGPFFFCLWKTEYAG